MGPWAFAVLLGASSFQGGTQPGELQNPVGGSESCKQCHFSPTTVMQNNAYRGTMMDLASVDPFFLAALEIANVDNALGAELCVRCHFPGGWMQGQGTPTDGSGIATQQKVGISCDLCHRVKTPPPALVEDDGGVGLDGGPMDGGLLDAGALMGSDAGDAGPTDGGRVDGGPLDGGAVEAPPDFSGVLAENAQLFIEDSSTAQRGPFASDQTNGHTSTADPLFKDSLFCAQCHEVSNPLLTWKNVAGEVLGPQFPAERTYTEWKNSAFAVPGEDFASCQDCHMKRQETLGLAATTGDQPRELNSHEIVGGNTLAPLMVAHLQQGPNVPPFLQGLAQDAQRIVDAAEQQLKTKSAELSLQSVNVAERQVVVRVENKTGHKLPTGYAEGRRMWIGHDVTQAGGGVTSKTGTPDATTFDFEEDPVRVYEIKLGDDTGPSFHFIQVDRIYKDNRIPPRGFRPTLDTEPVDYTFGAAADGSMLPYDDVVLPLGEVDCFPAVVDVKLYYQTASGEYFRFLRDNAAVQGPKLEEAWLAVGGGTPVVMQEKQYTVFADGTTQEGGGPFACEAPIEDAGPSLDAGPSDEDAGLDVDGGLEPDPTPEPSPSPEPSPEPTDCSCSASSSEQNPAWVLLLLGGILMRSRTRKR